MSRIAVIGTGYVGLTTGACFAPSATTWCAPTSTQDKVERLQRGEIPILEAGPRGDRAGGPRLGSAAASCSAPPPPPPTASSPTCACRRPRARTARPTCPTSRTAARQIGPCCPREAVVINKSTVPVGSTRVVERALGRDDVAVVSNPEFLREGSAVHDFLNPDRIVIGADDQSAAIRVAVALPRASPRRSSSPTRRRRRPSSTPPTPSSPPRSPSSTRWPRSARPSAPTSTTSCWAWATTSASARVPEARTRLRVVAASPKDTRAMVQIAEEAGYDFHLLKGVIQVNDEQYERTAEKAVELMGGDVDGKQVAAWGLTFKARTDDLRESPSLEVLGRLAARGAKVRAYDPAVDPPAATASRSCPTPTPPARAPTCCSCSPSGTSSTGSTSQVQGPHGARRRSSTPATCSTARRCPPRASPTTASGGLSGPQSSSPAAPASSAPTSATACSSAATRSSRSTTSSPAASPTSSTSSGSPGFTFVEHDVTDVHLGARRRSTPSCTSLARRRRRTTWRCRSRPSRSAASARTTASAWPRTKGARFFIASTSEVYGDPQVHPQTEEYWGHVNPVGPRGVYDEAKRFAEAITMAYHRHHGARRAHRAHLQHLRPAHAARRRAGRLELRHAGAAGRAASPSTATAARPGPSATSTTRSRGFLALLDSDHIGPINIGNPGEFTMLELAELVLEVTGSTSEIVHEPLPVDDPTQRKPDITLARELLGWEPKVELREGLTRTIEHFARLVSARVRWQRLLPTSLKEHPTCPMSC